MFGIGWHDIGIYFALACCVCVALSGGVMGRIGDYS